MKLNPIGNRVLLSPVTKKETNNGFIIPETTKDKPMHYIVQAVGQGWYNQNGQVIPIKFLKVGDNVLIEKHTGLEIKNDDGEIKRIVNANEILAILE